LAVRWLGQGINKARVVERFAMVANRIIGGVGRIEAPGHAVALLQQLESGQALALDADLVCGRDHLESAVEHARRAFERHTNVSSTLTMEAMLYASGERQIARATEKMGLKQGTERVALILFGADEDEALATLRLRRDDRVLGASREKALRFGVGEVEMAAASDATGADTVLERVAFADIQKR
jgi:KEOPS complex subunit Cgi121